MFDGNNQDLGAPLPDMGGDFGEKKSFFQKIFSKSETIIPIVLIVILVVVLVLAFSGWNYSNIPLVGGALQSLFGAKTYQVLVIGDSHPIVDDLIYNNKDFLKYYHFTQRTEEALSVSPENQLRQFDFIILDQSDSVTQMGNLKAIPVQLVDALKDYVASGKSLVIVGNSAHRVMGSNDLYGWKAIFGDIAPVSCDETMSPISPCETLTPVTAVLYNTGSNSIFKGIDEIPSKYDQQTGYLGYPLSLYPVSYSGDEWYYIKDVKTGKASIPGIVASKSMLGGKVIYISFQEWGYPTGVIKLLFEHIR